MNVYISPQNAEIEETLNSVILGSTIEMSVFANTATDTVDEGAVITWQLFTDEGTELSTNTRANLVTGTVANNILFVSADSLVAEGKHYLEIKVVYSTTNNPISIKRFAFNLNL